jgi:hypothetical protein
VLPRVGLAKLRVICRVVSSSAIARASGSLFTDSVRNEGPDGIGVHRVELKEAESKARDGQVLADLREWQGLDLTKACRATEPTRDHVAWLGLGSGDFADDGDRS